MKNFITRYAAWIIIAVMFVSLLPGIINRVSNENQNNNVIIAVHYNNLGNVASKPKLFEALDKFKEIGVTKATVQEEDLNLLVSRGDITSIKYNSLRHKYDKESLDIADFIAKNCPDVSYDSHIVFVARDHMKKRLREGFVQRYGKDEYKFAGTLGNIDLYVFYDGRRNLWDYTVGFNEDSISTLKNKGFDVTLTHIVKNYTRQGYIDDIERLVKKYDISYLNLKKSSYKLPDETEIPSNYKKLAKLIGDNNMTLVVTENSDQLSNHKFPGYDYVYNSVNKSTGKILRSYETSDDSQADDSHYKYRTEQFFNSTIDRNIRFVTVLGLAPENVPFDDCIDHTVKAVSEYKDKIIRHGLTVNGETFPMTYTANRRLNSGLCAVIMIMFALLMLFMVSGRTSLMLTLSAGILSVLAFGATLTVVPESLVSLYPTAYSVIQPCFIMTCVLYFNKKYSEKFSLPVMLISTLFITVAMLFVGSMSLGTMLSGRDYYLNNLIFRGIKLSLLAPTVYTAVIFYFMYIKDSDLLRDIAKVLEAKIKVYWVIIAGIIGAVGVYYIIRSGNVNKISGLEQLMRSTLTEIFAERPRTKEFLIGYPSMVLLVYYIKKCNVNVLKWILAVAASILVTSATNSFCHVFTGYTTILNRTLNGLIVGLPVAVFAYIGNLLLIKIVRIFSKAYNTGAK